MTTSAKITLLDEFIPESHSLRGQELEFEVTGEVYPFDHGNTYGPPENCCPPEGGEVDVQSFEPKPDEKGVYPVDPEWANKELMSLLESNDKFREYVEERMFENAQDSRDDDYGDYEYDRMKDEGRP